jgi:hypothetical protein
MVEGTNKEITLPARLGSAKVGYWTVEVTRTINGIPKPRTEGAYLYYTASKEAANAIPAEKIRWIQLVRVFLTEVTKGADGMVVRNDVQGVKEFPKDVVDKGSAKVEKTSVTGTNNWYFDSPSPPYYHDPRAATTNVGALNDPKGTTWIGDVPTASVFLANLPANAQAKLFGPKSANHLAFGVEVFYDDFAVEPVGKTNKVLAHLQWSVATAAGEESVVFRPGRPGDLRNDAKYYEEINKALNLNLEYIGP